MGQSHVEDHTNSDTQPPVAAAPVETRLTRMCRDDGITMSVRCVPTDTTLTRRYSVCLRRGRRRVHVQYDAAPLTKKQDIRVADVVCDLLRRATRGALSFEAWCRDTGSDTDSRRAYRAWQSDKRAVGQAARVCSTKIKEFKDAGLEHY